MTTRTDDRFMRRVIYFLISIVVAQGGGWVWTIAVLYSQVQNLESDVNQMVNTNTKLAVIELEK